ncbi:hypothetical protein ACLB2K_040661 [Fragaria x ananassa]
MRARDDRFVLPVSQAKECKQILSGGPWFYRRSQFVLAEYDGLQNVALVPIDRFWYRYQRFSHGFKKTRLVDSSRHWWIPTFIFSLHQSGFEFTRISLSLLGITAADLAMQLARFRSPRTVDLGSDVLGPVSTNPVYSLPSISGVKRGAEMALIIMGKRGRGFRESWELASQELHGTRKVFFGARKPSVTEDDAEGLVLEASPTTNVLVFEDYVLEEISPSYADVSLKETPFV